MVKLAIVDDHGLFRTGLVAILNKEPMFSIVGEFESLSSIKSLVPQMDIDILLVDISLDKESGFDVAKYIKEMRPSIKIIILSAHKEEFYVINAMEAGVDGYIHKDSKPEELILGINKVLQGEKFYSAEISTLLINNIYNKSYKGLPYLTNKEKQVIKYLVEGYSSKEIAAKLSVSPRTIETHRANVLGKFGLRNTTELIKNVVEQKIKF